MKNHALKVDDKFRINPLSHIDGGVTVIIETVNGSSFEYDKIKYPQLFIKKALLNKKNKNAWIKNA